MRSIPRTRFSTRLSGSERETAERIRDLFQRRKKRPPAALLIPLALLIALCGSLVGCQTASLPQDGSLREPVSLSTVSPEPDLPSPDLNRNGIPEEVRLVGAYGSQELQFWEDGQLIDREVPGVCLYSMDRQDYILRASLEEYQGSFFYHYELADLSGEFEETARWDRVTFDLNFHAPFHQGFDPEAIAAFVEELDGLLAHSVRLSGADGRLVTEAAPAVALDWLDSFPDIFVRDPEASLAEDLAAFQDAMSRAVGAPVPLGETETLPLEESLQMTFSSGAGAWSSDLELRPDGTFAGDYHDADGATLYVCRFHGSFRDFVQLTDSSWLLTLDELVLDTGRPLGEEWDEEGFHYISSGPHGFTDREGTALRPGAQFILYTPQAQGHAPGTELYGAYDLWTWWPEHGQFLDAGDTLGCYGLYNLTADVGFFS